MAGPVIVRSSVNASKVTRTEPTAPPAAWRNSSQKKKVVIIFSSQLPLAHDLPLHAGAGLFCFLEET